MSEPQQNYSWCSSAPLATVLKAGAIISGTNGNENRASNPAGLPNVLRSRLEQFDAFINGAPRTRSLDLPDLQLDTACASLYVVERVHNLLVEHDAQQSSRASISSLIGAKDMAQIRTHISVAFNWGTGLLLSRIIPTLPGKTTRSLPVPPPAQIIDLTTTHEDYALLFDFVTRMLKIILPDGPQGPHSATFVATTVLNRGFTDLLKACIFLAWLPNSVRGDIPLTPDLKPYVARLLNASQTAQSITALGTIMRNMQRPLYVRKVCRILSTEQLLRSTGVVGLLSSVFGEDLSSTEAPLEKLQSTSNVLNTLPPNMPPEEYYPLIIPQLLRLLSPSMDKVAPPSHRRAAAFALSRLLSPGSGPEDKVKTDIQIRVLNWCLLDPFKPILRSASEVHTASGPLPYRQGISTPTDEATKTRAIATDIITLPPSQAVPTLSTILMNTDPSPGLIDVILTPIAGQLYTLLEYLRRSKMSDPLMREIVESLLGSWARIAGEGEIVHALWGVIQGQAGEWDLGDAGELHVFERSESLPSLTLAQLADLQEGKLENEGNEEDNPLNLHPHPLYFAQFVESIKREGVTSALYLRILDAHLNLNNENDPLQKLLLFTLSMQISSHAGIDVGEDSPLRRPDVARTLMFIKLTLDQDEMVRKPREAGDGNGKTSRESLRFMPEGEDNDGDGDSDDEDLAPGLEGVSRKEHLSVTAVNLLLSLLQEHPELSPRTEPLLNDIYTQLEPLASSASDALRPRAREARITLTARLALSSPAAQKKNETRAAGGESPQEKYQQALKLLQDPLLPVRAHGLLLLRELVAPAKVYPARRKDEASTRAGIVSAVQGSEVTAPSVDSALVPAILSIFIQSIQDEDSYIFLNAVQGLAAMVDGFGREVLKSLADEYSKGLGGIGGSADTMTTMEVDLRVRIGEALGQVIKRCGGTLGKYVDIIVPKLFAVVRAAHLPTTLRTSSLSLLATAVDTNMLALSAYSVDLVAAMVDLVQVESVQATAPTPARKIPETPGNFHSPDACGVGSQSCEETNEKKETRPGVVGRGAGSQSRTDFNSESSAGKVRHPVFVPHLAGEKMDVNAAEVGNDGNDIDDGIVDTMDTRPTLANPKFPPLRRAALHFLSLVLRSLTTRIHEEGWVPGGNNVIPSGIELRRAASVLVYVSTTDEDRVVRVMARETVELLQQLRGTILGV